jgi:predicted AlkP superfamily pyrophosphatase or phosphodiesterase
MIHLKICIMLISLMLFHVCHLVKASRLESLNQKPLMLLVSFDGFRWDYLHMHNLSNFNYLKSIGSHAEFIYNSFSTVTFPNHWTIVTGNLLD